MAVFFSSCVLTAPPSISSPAEVTTTEDALAVLLPFSVLSFSGDFNPEAQWGDAECEPGTLETVRKRKFGN